MARDRSRNCAEVSSRRTKARHDPHRPPRYDEESEEEEDFDEEESEEEEQPLPRRLGRRAGKDIVTGRYAPHPRAPPRQAPYMTRTMPASQGRLDPREHGAAHDICPQTPEHLVAAFTHEQRNHNTYPRLRPPGTIHGFAAAAPRDYYKQSIALKNQRATVVYLYQKNEGLEYRFWCDFHKDFYLSMILIKDLAPIVPMRYIDWKYFEDMHDSTVNEVIAKCIDFALREIMAFKYNWNTYVSSMPRTTTRLVKIPSIGPLRDSIISLIT